LLIDLQEADQNLETVVKYARMSKEFYKHHKHMFWINFTDCVKIARYTDRRVNEVKEFKALVKQLTRVEEREQTRFKRGIFNFVGGIIKILFGTMDSDDATYYAENVSNLEKEELDFLFFLRNS
jgi:hypothetical protein